MVLLYLQSAKLLHNQEKAWRETISFPQQPGEESRLAHQELLVPDYNVNGKRETCVHDSCDYLMKISLTSRVSGVMNDLVVYDLLSQISCVL